MQTGFTSNTRAFLPCVGRRIEDLTLSHIQLIQFIVVDLESLVQPFSHTQTEVKTCIFRTEKEDSRAF